MKYTGTLRQNSMLWVVFLVLKLSFSAQAQFTVEVTILEGEATTTCRDGLFNQNPGQPMWSIAIEDEPEVVYSNLGCPAFIPYPNEEYVHFRTEVNCLSDLNGGRVFVCIRAFDHDPPNNDPCDVADENNRKDCLEVPCEYFFLPSPGTDTVYTYIPTDTDLESTGYVTFRVSVSEDAGGRIVATNDNICQAINLGVLEKGTSLGDNLAGAYSNHCATNTSEPSPHTTGATWSNNNAVWFFFTTGTAAGVPTIIQAASDPLATEDEVDLQLALYQLNGTGCEGNLSLVSASDYADNSFSESLFVECLSPNTPYFLMVNGAGATAASLFGVFGLQIIQPDIPNPINDDICGAIELPLQIDDEENRVDTYANFCTNNLNDPEITEFDVSHSVWFKFRPGETGSVAVRVAPSSFYNTALALTQPEVAVFYAPDGQCTTGSLEKVIATSEEATIHMECLNSQGVYYVLVDGGEEDPVGVFTLSVTEEASNLPAVTFSEIHPVSCRGGNDGGATIAEDDSYAAIWWDNGATTYAVTNLAAGRHDVTVTDINGCQIPASIDIPQPADSLSAIIQITEPVLCTDGNDGALSVISTGGNSNHQYEWNTGDLTKTIRNLVAGTYQVTATDEKGCETTQNIQLTEPAPIVATLSTQDITCFGEENGGVIFIENLSGGSSPYTFLINDTAFTEQTIIPQLPAGIYQIIVQDNNGCEELLNPVEISKPAKLTVTLGQDQQISFGETAELVAESSQLATYQWSGTDSISCEDCSSIVVMPSENATYTVTVTNPQTGCTASDTVAVEVIKSQNIFIPNVFTPNGDGNNDFLEIKGGSYVDKVLRFDIYARNGALVYSRQNFSLTEGVRWDGTFNEQSLPAGVFIYVAEIQFANQSTTTITGDLTLLR